MTREELEKKIQELTGAAQGLEEPNKTLKNSEVNNLKNQLEGMALDELRQKLEQVRLPDLQEMDAQIAAAKNATSAHQARVNAFNEAIGILKIALGIML